MVLFAMRQQFPANWPKESECASAEQQQAGGFRRGSDSVRDRQCPISGYDARRAIPSCTNGAVPRTAHELRIRAWRYCVVEAAGRKLSMVWDNKTKIPTILARIRCRKKETYIIQLGNENRAVGEAASFEREGSERQSRIGGKNRRIGN